ncbi:MAG TPA: beta-ketoacyl-[acyl-carrier-protein] synthase II, partial [Ignavibacteriales bacterium]|nr:beta-ketoacyl-[acyl-carrier-protein] synthase II [Ignavibacteriales bacterium]
MERRRAVVTGLGVLTSIGIGVDDFWNGLQQGRNGVGLITRFDTTNFDTKFAAEIKNFNSDNYMDRKAAKRMDLFTQYAMATSEMAMNDSRLNLDKIDKEKFGVIFGSGIGGMTTLEQQHW